MAAQAQEGAVKCTENMLSHYHYSFLPVAVRPGTTAIDLLKRRVVIQHGMGALDTP
jgi:hypothetical protein